MYTLKARHVLAAALLLLAWLMGVAHAASQSEITAYSRRMPTTPANATSRWVKIWYDGKSWHIAWAATEAVVGTRGRRKVLSLEIQARVDRVGDGEIGTVNTGRRAAGEALEEFEHNEKAFHLKAPLTPLPRALSFTATAEKLKFNFIVDGRRNASDIVIGEQGESPKSLPFTLSTPDAPEQPREEKQPRAPKGPARRRRRRWRRR